MLANLTTNDGFDAPTMITLVALIMAFISLYVLYDKSRLVRVVADFVLFLSPGRKEKDKLLTFIFPPLVLLAFGLLFRYWDYIVNFMDKR